MLNQVVRRRAFASPTKPEELARVYLSPGSFNAPRADVDLMEILRAPPPSRAVVRGTPGSGKTSLIVRVLADLHAAAPGAGHEALILSVGDPQVFSSQQAHLQHVLQTIRVQGGRFASIDAGEFDHAAASQRSLAGAQVTHRSTGSAAIVSYQVEVKEAVDVFTLDTTGLADLRKRLRDILDRIRGAGYRPVIVIDDTDRYAKRGPEGGLDVDSIATLFQNGVPALCEVDVDVVVAVHPRYEDVAAYSDAISRYGFEVVDVPELPVTAADDPRPLARILKRRLDHHGIDVEVDEVVDAGAISVLEGLYVEHAANLRWVLNLADAAARVAHGAGAERLADTHVFTAQKHMLR